MQIVYSLYSIADNGQTISIPLPPLSSTHTHTHLRHTHSDVMVITKAGDENRQLSLTWSRRIWRETSGRRPERGKGPLSLSLGSPQPLGASAEEEEKQIHRDYNEAKWRTIKNKNKNKATNTKPAITWVTFYINNTCNFSRYWGDVRMAGLGSFKCCTLNSISMRIS